MWTMPRVSGRVAWWQRGVNPPCSLSRARLGSWFDSSSRVDDARFETVQTNDDDLLDGSILSLEVIHHELAQSEPIHDSHNAFLVILSQARTGTRRL